jgi:ribonuclease Y
MDVLLGLGLLLGMGLGLIMAHFYLRRRYAQSLRERSEKLEVEMREAKLVAREQFIESELALKKQASDLQSQQQLQAQNADQLAKKELSLNEQLAALLLKKQRLSAQEEELSQNQQAYHKSLEQLAEMDLEQVRSELVNKAEIDCEQQIRLMRQQKMGRAEFEITEDARRVLLAAMQRITSRPMNDATATVVALPSEEMKGRIIGREGRNIRTFEHATGTTLMIDETPDSVLISCFDPVRREIARIALEGLLKDGWIHPASIEDAVIYAEKQMDETIVDLGETALMQLRLSNVHPEVVRLLGKLNYRLSNNQNTLAHSVEVANLCALLASEIGLDAKVAKRAGLFHDIGKALPEEFAGSHARAGAEFVKRYSECPQVVNAVAAHHQEVPAESVYAPLVMVADALSAVRPGARTSSIDGFIQRVRAVEKIAQAQAGVREAYAIQAGRAVRIIVEPNEVDDDAARQMAFDIRNQIESELNYPGSIEITVIREQRFSETAV